MFDFSDWQIRDINKRLDEISLAVETRSGDTSALLAEVEALNARKRECVAQHERREKAKAAVAAGYGTKIPMPSPKYTGDARGADWSPPELQRHSIQALTNLEDMPMTDLEGNPINQKDMKDTIIFRSGDKLTDKYPESAEVSFDKCLRAIISGNQNELTDVEKRSITPSQGGAILNPQLSSILLDSTRQSDWLEVLRPTYVDMTTEEMKIPRVARIPEAIMHKPGVCEDFSDLAIDAVWLRAKTMMVLVECTNELLNDSRLAQDLILRTASTAISNKLLQQFLYGQGDGSRAEDNPEMQGVATYPAASFADYEEDSDEADLYRLATRADVAIRRNNGQMNGVLYGLNLEDRLNERTDFGTIKEPSRAFARLENAGRAISHPSVNDTDMLYLDSSEIYYGFRSNVEVLVDPYTTANCYTTRFRLVLRGDVFYNTAHMAYYPNIGGTPTP